MATRITNLENPQQMDVVVSGPDTANRLYVCTGIAPAQAGVQNGTTTQVYTWLVGPVLTHAQFFRAVGNGAICRWSIANLTALSQFVCQISSFDADWDDESGQVEVRAEISVTATGQGYGYALAVSYHVSILAQAPAG